MTNPTQQTEDDLRLDREARAIHEAINACWKILSDLDVEAKALALDRLMRRLAYEESTYAVPQ